MSAQTATAEAPVPAPAAPPKSKLGLVIAIVVILLAAAGGGGFWFWKSRQAAPAADGQAVPAALPAAHYQRMEPAFVVNLADEEAARFLQVEMEVMAREASALEHVTTHMPRIRNSLLLLLGSHHVRDLSTREGKEKLRADVIAEVQKVLTEETGKPQIEAVYFNSFVMQ